MYLKHLVEAISISPSNECMLRDPQILLDSALTNGDDDPSQEVEQVTRVFSQYVCVYIIVYLVFGNWYLPGTEVFIVSSLFPLRECWVDASQRGKEHLYSSGEKSTRHDTW